MRCQCFDRCCIHDVLLRVGSRNMVLVPPVLSPVSTLHPQHPLAGQDLGHRGAGEGTAPSVITTMHKAQTHWAGHALRMSDSRIPKQLLYGELIQGARKIGGQRERFKDSLKTYLKDFNIDIFTWEKRSIWQNSLAKHDSQGRPPLGRSTIQRR